MLDAGEKNRKIEIEFKLSPISGSAKSDSGMLDPTLFKGGNSLWAKMETQTCLWRLEYDKGVLPGGLKGRWTSYSQLLRHVVEYMKRRNVHIVEIKD